MNGQEISEHLALCIANGGYASGCTVNTTSLGNVRITTIDYGNGETILVIEKHYPTTQKTKYYVLY